MLYFFKKIEAVVHVFFTIPIRVTMKHEQYSLLACGGAVVFRCRQLPHRDLHWALFPSPNSHSCVGSNIASVILVLCILGALLSMERIVKFSTWPGSCQMSRSHGMRYWVSGCFCTVQHLLALYTLAHNCNASYIWTLSLVLVEKLVRKK